jgi:hypothetical protein
MRKVARTVFARHTVEGYPRSTEGKQPKCDNLEKNDGV